MLKKWMTVAVLWSAATCFAGVDVNKANAAELDSIKGIGPAMSTKILAERKKGSFKDWTDLIGRVNGIGPGNASKFSKEGLTVAGAEFKAANAQASKEAPASAAKK